MPPSHRNTELYYETQNKYCARISSDRSNFGIIFLYSKKTMKIVDFDFRLFYN